MTCRGGCQVGGEVVEGTRRTPSDPGREGSVDRRPTRTMLGSLDPAANARDPVAVADHGLLLFLLDHESKGWSVADLMEERVSSLYVRRVKAGRKRIAVAKSSAWALRIGDHCGIVASVGLDELCPGVVGPGAGRPDLREHDHPTALSSPRLALCASNEDFRFAEVIGDPVAGS